MTSWTVSRGICFETLNYNNMTGIELVTKERQEQIEKHGYDKYHDDEVNDTEGHDGLYPLATAAIAVVKGDDGEMPAGWDQAIANKMCSKPYMKRLIIGAALFIAEIDRIIFEKSQAQ